MYPRIINSLIVLFLSSIISSRCLAESTNNSISNVERMLTLPTDKQPLVVKASLDLHDISQINDEDETFHFSGVLTLSWKDERQAFNPDESGTPYKTYTGNYQVDEISPSWYPQIFLSNQADQFEVDNPILKVYPDGNTTLIQTINATAKVSFNMRRYPFDKQHLEAVFEVLGYDKSEVILEAQDISAEQMNPNFKISQWNIERIYSSTEERRSITSSGKVTVASYVFNIDVNRQSLFVMRLVVLPLMLIVMLSWSVFWMDKSSLGDRISVSFIGILTAVAYQIVLGDILPHISYVTLMNGFINISLILMSATVVMNLIIGALDKQGRSHLGDIIDRRCRYIFPITYLVLLIFAVMVAFILF